MDENMKTADKGFTGQEQCPYLTIREFAKRYSTWSESSIRWSIYTNKAGFNEMVIRRDGKKILISVKDFWLWIETQNQKGTGSGLCVAK